jgi:hypothetical protein
VRRIYRGIPVFPALPTQAAIAGAVAVMVVCFGPTRSNAAFALSDSLYRSHHPRLLFTTAEIPALRAKITDGGYDAAAFQFIRDRVTYVYPTITPDSLLDNDWGMEQIQNLGLAAFLGEEPDTAALQLGKNITMYIADSSAVDGEIFTSSLRLRSLALGYDMFFDDATVAEREYIRGEILEYLQFMLNAFDYEVWFYQPYTSNKTAMLAAAIGLAAIALDGEMDSSDGSAALTAANAYFDAWREAQLGPDGSYGEGALYAAWSLRHLIYYFHARLRFDGYDFSKTAGIRSVEKWLAYELDALSGNVNNLHDCTAYQHPLARHNTYFDWAQTAWGSSLAAYIWEHVAGPYGFDHEDFADKAATVLWNQGLQPSNPSEVLPRSMVWTDRGLYYYRDGWPSGEAGKNVVFSLYSGAFSGGHAQEDQNQFTLTAYGVKFAIDHGAGRTAGKTSAHNLVLVDGAGQHYAGTSIGTDGRMAAYLFGDYADYIFADATAAYATHSPLNDYGVPFPWSDWSWGYRGANPVQKAYREVFVVHDPATPPYFLIVDDIRKDGTVHDYTWRMHTAHENVISGTKPIRISQGSVALDVHVIRPSLGSLTISTSLFDNACEDTNSKVLSLSTRTVEPEFALLLVPWDAGIALPTVVTTPAPWGYVTSVLWPGGIVDLILFNPSNETVESDDAPTLVSPSGAASSIETDARVALIRLANGVLRSYLLTAATELRVGNIQYVSIEDGPMNVSLAGNLLHIDRRDADFVLFGPNVIGVYYRDMRVPTVKVDGYFYPHEPLGPHKGQTRPIEIGVYPNPLNPTARIALELPTDAQVTAVVYDVAGREVVRLWSGRMPAGPNQLDWSGHDADGRAVPSGLYFLRIATGGESHVRKLVVLR